MTTPVIPTKETYTRAIQLLKDGKLVAFPTETVYGLGADATNAHAVAALYAAKNRPEFNPLITHYADLASLAKDALLTPLAQKFAQQFWPGPLTLILKKTPNCRVAQLATAGLDTIAVRIPAHPVTLMLLQEFQRPLVAPSANASGKISPVTATHVKKSLGTSVDLILDGGKTGYGLESTIIDLSTNNPVILRHGALPKESIEALLSISIQDYSLHTHTSTIKAPGMLLHHYAPSCPLRLSTDNPQPGEALLAFGSSSIPTGFNIIKNLSTTGNLEEAAVNLFEYLHALEELDISGIAVMPIPNYSIGRAINDKLKRAALR